MKALPSILLLAFVAAHVLSATEKPNIIVILSDDVGYSDIGCFGGEIETPNLDALAKGGLRFTQFYNTARCCPTRASLLTGLYAHQAGIGHMATCVDVSGASYPKEHHGNVIQPMEGISLAPVFSGGAIIRSQPLFWEHEGNRAIRRGEWKLVSKHPGRWELYNMTADRTEMEDLAVQQPDRVKDMAAQWDAWAKRVGVQPWPLRGGEAKKGADNSKK